MAGHDDGTACLQGLCGVQHMAQQRAPGQGVQDLGQWALHACTFTRRHNDYINGLLFQHCVCLNLYFGSQSMSLSKPSFTARLSTRSARIIGALLLVVLIVGCSAMRLGYNTAPTLAYWWLDSYFDFDGEQSLRMRADLQAVQDWHRKQELPLLIQTLKELQTMAPKPVTPAQVCAMVNGLQTRIQVTLERVAPTIAAIAPTLQVAQLEHVAREFEKRDKKWRTEWLEGTLAERTDRRVEQIVDRAESLYGTLEPAQIAIVRAHIDASSFDGPRQHRELLRRHKDALQVLTTLRTSKVPPAQATADIRGLLERTLKAPDPAFRQYIDRLTLESCVTTAAVHNSSSSRQRARLLQTLQDYEGDASALASQNPQAAPNPASSPTF
jgi:HPt (histidine-containing phosphotransfer) domain-containing protein